MPTTGAPLLSEPDLQKMIVAARADRAFAAVNRRFEQAKVVNWLKEEEKALLFGLAAFLPGDGTIVEIGSFEGGSTIFSAAGLSRRGEGSVTAIDPHLGAPPWLGTVPGQWTFQKFQQHIQDFGLTPWVCPRLGDSSAIAAVWDATPIDLVLIDGDHSFAGALKDFECFAPKVRFDGLILIDDADEPWLPGVTELVAELKTMRSVAYVGMIGGIAVFRRLAVDAWELLREVAAIGEKRKQYRGWDMCLLHGLALPSHFLRSAQRLEPALREVYHLSFLARCPAGAYGYTPGSRPADRELLQALSDDRRDGPVIALGEQSNPTCRTVLGTPAEAPRFARCLFPGGLFLGCRPQGQSREQTLIDYRLMTGVGLEGVGHSGSFFWGVWRPQQISAEALIQFAVQAVARASDHGG
jgi:predicted O-methyltransferase YrrM